MDWNELDVLFQKDLFLWKKKSSKIFPRIRWKIPQDFNQCKVRDFFHPFLYPADPTWASCWSTKHSFQTEGFMGASINNQTKTQNCTKNQNVQKSTKNTFQNHSLCPKKTPTLSRRTLKPSFCALWPLCISFSFSLPSPLGKRFSWFFSNFGLEATRVMARPWHGWRRSLPEKQHEHEQFAPENN